MQTTIGQLVSALFDAYESRYHDPKLAALATEVTLTELLAGRDGRGRDGRWRQARDTSRDHVSRPGRRAA